MKLAIVTPKNFDDFSHLEKVIKSNFDLDNIILVAGNEDVLVKQLANKYGLAILTFPTDWKKYGKQAEINRNTLMVNSAEHLLAFFDGTSALIKQTISAASTLNLKTTIITVHGKDNSN